MALLPQQLVEDNFNERLQTHDAILRLTQELRSQGFDVQEPAEFAEKTFGTLFDLVRMNKRFADLRATSISPSQDSKHAVQEPQARLRDLVERLASVGVTVPEVLDIVDKATVEAPAIVGAEGEPMAAMNPADSQTAPKSDNASMADGPSREEMKASIGEATANLRSEFAGMRSEMSAFRADMKGLIDGMRLEVTKGFGDVRVDMAKNVGDLKAEIHQSANATTRWTIATLLAVVGGVIALANFLGKLPDAPGKPPQQQPAATQPASVPVPPVVAPSPGPVK